MEDKSNKNEFVSLLKERTEILSDLINKSNNLLEKCNYKIDLFYCEQDYESALAEINNVAITSDLNNKLIDDKIKRYEIIIGLLQEKLSIVSDRLKSGYYDSDLLVKNDMKIDLFRIQSQIISKKEFLASYKKRKK
jgi:hypothetical protein